MSSTDFVAGDGFSSSERTITAPKTTTATDYTQSFVAPSTRPFQTLAIASLAPSSAAITFVGRVVNLFHFANNNQKPRAATGCLRFILRGLDGTGLITVRLWYADSQYPIRLGAKVVVWTTHIGLSEDGKLAPAVAKLCTSVFPERDRGCHVQVKNEEEWEDKSAEKWSRQAKKAELMTLEGFARGGINVPEARVMACVKSVGGRKKVTRKDNTITENVTVHIYDHTSTEATLTLWDHSTHSASAWKPSQTVLLLTNPGYRTSNSSSKTWFSLTSATAVDVDPPVRDALWLRTFATRLFKRQDTNPPFPHKLFEAQFTTVKKNNKPDLSLIEDVENADSAATTATVLTPVNRILYTLASLDAFARSHPSHPLTGYLSVLLLPLNLVSLHQRHRLFSGHCGRCNLALHANTATTACPSCSPSSSNRTSNTETLPSSYTSWEGSGTQRTAEEVERLVELRLNPHILGDIIDETGKVASGKLVWRNEAWEELFGLPYTQLEALDRETLRRLEARCAWVRVSLFVGFWGEHVGMGVEKGQGKMGGPEKRVDRGAEAVRLCVLGVRL